MQFSHVFLQVEVPAESLSADLAREWLLVVVGVHVEREIVNLVERLVANVALVRLFAAVRQLVILVVSLLMEPLPAILAHERFVVGVDAPVRVQGRASVESFAAGRTLVRLLRRVDDLVPAQSARLAKPFAAYLADERPRPRVDGHVSGQIVVGVEHLAAFRAGECLLFVRRTEFVTPWSGALLFTLALGRDRSQAHLRESFLNGDGGRRILWDGGGGGWRSWEGTQQRVRMIIEKGVRLQEILLPQRWHVLLER